MIMDMTTRTINVCAADVDVDYVGNVEDEITFNKLHFLKYTSNSLFFVLQEYLDPTSDLAASY